MPATARVNSKDFDHTFEVLLHYLVYENKTDEHISESLNRYEKVLRYNVPYRVKMSGYLVPTAYEKICGGNNTMEEIHLAYVLGWIWRMTQAFLTMLEENLGENEVHLGRLTWLHLNNKKPIAMIDSVLIEQGANRILRKYFGKSPLYPVLLDFFSDLSFEYLLATNMVQQLTKLNVSSLREFTVEKRLACAKSTTGKVRFAGAAQLALILAGTSREEEIWERVNKFYDVLAEFWVVKEDLKDSFAESWAKGGQDKNIKMGNCTWLIAKALEICDDKQWYVLDENYGNEDNVSVTKVKNLFMDLRIPEIGKEHLKILLGKLNQDCDGVIKDGHGIGYYLRQVLNSYGRLDF